MIKTNFIFAALFLLSGIFLYSQEKENVPDDSESEAIERDIKTDSIPHTPLKIHGKVNALDSAGFFINKYDIQFSDYSSINDLILERSSFFPLKFGTIAEPESFSSYGARSYNNRMGFNNRPIIAPDYIMPDLLIVPSEAFENIEVLTGSDAAIFGSSAGAYINRQEIIYNTAVPITRMFYSQGSYDYINADGIFSQNIANGLNMNIGFRSAGSGGRFDNSQFETWNVRGGFRYNPDTLTSISFVENFSHLFSGKNGGVAPLNSLDLNDDGIKDIHDEIEAAVRFVGMNQRSIRHDVTLTASKFTDDAKSFFLTGSLYLSTIQTDYRRNSAILDTIVNEVYSNHYYGATGKLEKKFDGFLTLTSGADLQFMKIEKTSYNDLWDGFTTSLFSRGKISVSDIVNISGGVSYGRMYDYDIFSAGSRVELILTDSFIFYGDLSISEQPVPIVWGDSLSKESHLLGITGFEYNISGLKLKVDAFYRTINDVIKMTLPDTSFNSSFKNQDSETIIGGSIKVEGKLVENVFSSNDFFYFNMKYLFQSSSQNGNETKRFPAVYAINEIYYQYTISESILRIGFYHKGFSDYSGEGYLPQIRAFYPVSENQEAVYEIIGAYAKAKLGNAHIRFSFNNLLGTGYYYSPYYPELVNDIRLTVSMSFLD